MTARVVEHAATVAAQICEAAEHRDTDRQRTWIALVDGNNHQIDLINREAPTAPTDGAVSSSTSDIYGSTTAALAESSAAPPERLRICRDGRAHASAGRCRAAGQSAGSAPPTTPDELPTAPAKGDHAGALVVSAGPDQWLAQGQDLWPGA